MKKRDKDIIIFDIGSESVRGALINQELFGLPVIKYITKRYNIDSIGEKKDIVKSLEKAIAEISNRQKSNSFLKKIFGKQKDFDILCFLSYPWQKSGMISISKEFSKPVKMDKDAVNEIMKKEGGGEISKWRREVSGDNLVIMNKKVTEILLNGYKVNSLDGQIAKEVKLFMHCSAVDNELIKELEITLSLYRSAKSNLEFFSYPLASFSVLRDTLFHQKNFIYADITKRSSESMLVKKDNIVKINSALLGYNHLIDKISGKLNIPPYIAQSYLDIFAMGKIEKSLEEKMEEICSEFFEDWKRILLGSILETNIPVFITTNKRIISLFEKYLSNNSKVIVLNEEIFYDKLKLGRGVKTDLFIMIEAMFADKIYGEM